MRVLFKVQGASLFLLALLLLAAGCKKDRADIFEYEPVTLSPVAMDSAVAFVSKTFETAYIVSFDASRSEPSVETVNVGRDPDFVAASRSGEALYVICHGAVEGDVGKEDAEEESLHVIDVDTGAKKVFTLGSPFTGLAQSGSGKWLIAYFRREVSGNNPNLMAVIDLGEDPSGNNPFIRDIRSLGSVPLSVVFLEDIDVQTGESIVKKNFALVLSESYVTFLDLDHPERTEISVRLAVPGLGESVIPTEDDVIAANDPNGVSSRVLLRSDNASDIFSITFIGITPEAPGGNDYRGTLNQLSVDVNPNAAPSDMALFEEGGKQLVLATNRIAGSIAVLDPETTMVTPILTDFPTDKVLIFDNGRMALLYAAGEEMAYFVTFENILEAKEMNLEEYSFGGSLAAFMAVSGRDFAAFTLSGEYDRLFFIDLQNREMAQVYLSNSALNAQFLMYPDGDRVMINPVNQKEVWFISDMDTYNVERIIVDERVGNMWLLEDAGKIVLDHQYTEGYFTFIDAGDPQRSGAVSIWGFLFEDVLSIDPDDYPLSER